MLLDRTVDQREFELFLCRAKVSDQCLYSMKLPMPEQVVSMDKPHIEDPWYFTKTKVLRVNY